MSHSVSTFATLHLLDYPGRTILLALTMTSTLLLASDPRSNKVAGFVMFFSVLLLVEGTTRVNLHILPGGPWRGSHTVFPPVVAVISAVGGKCLAIARELDLAESAEV